VLSDPEEFKRLLKSNYDLSETAQQFPNHAEELITRALSDPEGFKCFIKDNIELTKTAQQFPNHAEELIIHVFSDLKEFKRLIRNNDDLRRTERQFLEFLGSTEALITIVLALYDREEFKHLIENNWDLITTAVCFPKHAEELITRVLSDPEEFKRLITNNDELKKTAEKFPNHKILQSKSVEEALEKIIKKIEFNKVRDASSTLGQAFRDEHHPFFSKHVLPEELSKKIASHTADPSKVSEKEAEEVAHKSFTKPPTKK
jgi:hypothetical protein